MLLESLFIFLIHTIDACNIYIQIDNDVNLKFDC